ncbi:Mss4-like protein [Auriculariales sp. MPI-PUGE-AT-0066]|nr:Mss4-like protein [Auriculariales sp. MPI-PUGE-AT-0066]
MAPPLVTSHPPILERVSFSEQTYHGSCHCEAVTFTLIAPSVDELEITTCNCTYCTKRSSANIYFKDTTMLTWTKGSWDDLVPYTFNTKRAAHYFCPKCGTSVGSRLGDIIVINLRCIDEPRLDIDELKRRHFDGLNAFPRIDKPAASAIA